MKLNLEEKNAIITGGSRGIGKSICDILEEEGVITHSISRTSILKADLSREDGISVAIGYIQSIKPKILINNVGGVGRSRGNLEYNINEAYRMNIRPMIRLTEEAIKQGVEKVVTISSIYGKEAGLNPWFTGAKAYQIAFMKEMSKLVPYVNFNTVCPGEVDVGKIDRLQYFGQPEDVGNLVAFLCSDKAKHINGACIVIDGGRGYSF